MYTTTHVSTLHLIYEETHWSKLDHWHNGLSTLRPHIRILGLIYVVVYIL